MYPPFPQPMRRSGAVAWLRTAVAGRACQWGLCLGLVAPLAILLVGALAIRQADGHSLVTDTISDLSAQDSADPDLMRAGMIGFGLAMVAFGSAVALALPVTRRAERLALPVFGASVALAGYFRDHSEAAGVGKNREGFLHNTFGNIAIVSLVVAMFSVYVVSRDQPIWRTTRRISIVALVLVTVSGAVFSLAPVTDRGAIELVLACGALCWIFATAWRALSASRGSPAA